jgi:hypothetical protein
VIREMKGWSRKFDDPITLPDGRKLITLKEGADHMSGGTGSFAH